MKLILSLNLLLFVALAEAQTVYKWVDENGDVHYSQTLPPERSQDAHDRLAADGTVTERIDRVRTAEERAALEAERARQREAAEQARLEAQQDRLFLAAFPTEADIRRAIESRREHVEAERRSVKSLVDQARTNFARALERAAELERAGQPVPDQVATQIRQARDNLRRFNVRLGRIDDRLEKLDRELAAELARHRRLTESG